MKGRRGGPPPAGKARRSQLLTTFGPGALVDLVDYAVVVGGPDGWRYQETGEGFITESRLEAKALPMLQASGYWRRGSVRLRRPPDCDDESPTYARGIPTAVFPSWFLCQNNACRSLVPRRGLVDGRHVCSEESSKSWPVVPFRFIAACPRGHLTDIPWRAFVHRGLKEDEVAEGWAWCHRQPGSGLKGDELGDTWTADIFLLNVGVSGDMTDYLVGCRRCGRMRGLQDLSLPRALGHCAGWRPWLGHGANEAGCPETPKMLARTASNTYFPQVVSVLSIPDSAQRIKDAVGAAWATVGAVTTPADLDTLLKLIPAVREALGGFPRAAVFAQIQQRQSGKPDAPPPIRGAEWRELYDADIEIAGDLPEPGERWFPRRLELDDLPTFIDRVVVVHALREVRALTGFTRIDGVSGDAEGELALTGQRTAPLSLNVDWIPAVEINGEGVFIAFDEAEVRRWEKRPDVQARAEHFRQALLSANAQDKGGADSAVPFGGARLLMLHSLAHMLITAISLECGYAASSIRERIYCYRAEDPAESRAGILLYTGTPGSEGTLGGLVEVGRDIVSHLRRAADMALLCSNDPVCAQHDPLDDQEGRDREGAACHSCLLIAEPSCERMNRDLDRALVVPTVDEARAGFLMEWMEGQGAERSLWPPRQARRGVDDDPQIR